MNKIITVSLLTILALVIFFAGMGLGVLYKTQQDAAVPVNSRSTDKMVSAVKALSSKLIPPTIAFGQVSKIEGRNIVLSFNGESIIFEVNDNTQIFDASPGNGNAAGTPKPLILTDIKKGDYLNVAFKVLSDGTIEAQSIYVVPPSVKI